MSSAPQNAISPQLEAPTATIRVSKGWTKPKRSIKSPATKAAVVAKRCQGDSKRKIARDLKLPRVTVGSILDEANLDQQLTSGQLQSAGLIPRAIGVIEHRLSLNSENAAIKVLENTIWPLDRKNSNRSLGHDTLLQVAITNLIQPATSNGGSAQSVQAETTPIPQVVDITPVSKS